MSARRWPVSVTTTSVPRWPPTGWINRTVGATAQAGTAAINIPSVARTIDFMIIAGKSPCQGGSQR